MQLRGGSSKGLYFRASDLPADEALRNRVVVAAMEGVGLGDPRQIDGLGCANVTKMVSVAMICVAGGNLWKRRVDRQSSRDRARMKRK